jgi:hypothetical protein
LDTIKLTKQVRYNHHLITNNKGILFICSLQLVANFLIVILNTKYEEQLLFDIFDSHFNANSADDEGVLLP